ncbi:MAG: hypothetical protein ACP5M0_03250 [Desulfomonilaceae bacterium]
MRYLIAVGICLFLLVGGTVPAAHSSMYWNFETPDLETLGEPEAAPQDSRPIQPARQKAPKMYDDYELPEIEPLSVDEPPRTAPLRATEDSVSAPVVRTQTPRRTEQAAPAETTVQTVSPRPAITQPGAQSTSPPPAGQPAQVTPGQTSAPSAATQTAPQEPVTKKMKWGKTDSGSN